MLWEGSERIADQKHHSLTARAWTESERCRSMYGCVYISVRTYVCTCMNAYIQSIEGQCKVGMCIRSGFPIDVKAHWTHGAVQSLAWKQHWNGRVLTWCNMQQPHTTIFSVFPILLSCNWLQHACAIEAKSWTTTIHRQSTAHNSRHSWTVWQWSQ